MPFSATVITLFPELFPGPLGASVLGRGLNEGLWGLDTLDLREFGAGKHHNVDDTPYGGGAGMVMRPDVISDAITKVNETHNSSRTLYMSPRGTPLSQPLAVELATEKHLTILCGRFEGVDARVIEEHNIEEISIGDYVLAGGEVAAMALLEACVRLLPGILGEHESIHEESFGLCENYAGLLEYPHYTRPPSWKGRDVPDVLLSGHHERIRQWRAEQAKEITKRRRPDLWKQWERRQAEEGNEI